MFFTDREKEIYQLPDGRKVDPLRVKRLLVIHTGNRLNDLIDARNGPAPVVMPDGRELSGGDVSKEGRLRTVLDAAEAELKLADAARSAMGFVPFPEGPTDGVVLEALYAFLEWLEGKGETAGRPSSPTASPPALTRSETTVFS